MCFSAFGVSAFAANYDGYKDADTVKTDYAKNETAIDVVTGLGIINGDDGYLNLGNGLTRAEAAKILAVVDLGTKTAASVNSSTVSTGYSDMKGHWASGYVAYATAKKYLAGDGDGTFKPDDPLTGYAFGKMMLNVLGYGLSDNKLVDGTTVKENKYTGDLWEINVLADGTEHNLFDKVDADLADDLTRADAMQIVYNTLLQTAKAKADKKAGEFYDVAGELEITTPTTSSADVDEGRPTVTVYNAKGDKLTSYAATPDYTFTAKAPGDNIDSVNKELNKKGDDKLEFVTGTDKVTGTAAYKNAAPVIYGAAEGDDVEVYLKPGSKTEIDVIVTTHYDLAKITDVKPLNTRELNANAKEELPEIKNAKNKVEIEIGSTKYTFYDTKFAGFDYEKDQYVLVAVKAGSAGTTALKTNAVLASTAAETVSGKITATKGTGAATEVAVDGTYYKVSMATAPALDDEGTWALDKAGKIGAVIKVDEVSSDYALIYNAVENTTRDEDGKDVKSHTVYVIKADGTKDSFTVANIPGANNLKDLLAKNEQDSWTFNWTADTAPVLVAYTLNDKGEIVAAKEKDTIGPAKVNVQIDKDHATIATKAYATANTSFVFVPTTGPDAYKPSVVVGYKDVNVKNTADTYYVVDAHENVLYAFVMAKNDSAVSMPKTAVVLDADPVKTNEAPNKPVFTYTVAVDGKETTITTANEISDVAAGDILSFTEKNGKATITDTVKATTYNTLTAETDKLVTATADYIIVTKDSNDTQLAITDKTAFYKITKYEDKGHDAYAVEAISGIKANDVLAHYGTTPQNELAVAFIFVDETPETSAQP